LAFLYAQDVRYAENAGAIFCRFWKNQPLAGFFMHGTSVPPLWGVGGILEMHRYMDVVN